jgi:hypothetical protein
LKRLSCAAALALAACASGGLVRPDPEALKIGETTPSQIVERFGPPTSRETMLRNGKPITLLAYLYTTEAEKHHGDTGTIASRSLYLFFHDDRLVGHDFRSSVAVDHTDFDLRKARAIVKGETKREEVTKLLGPPSGRLAYPMVDAATGEALLYAYTQQRRVPFGAPMVYTKSLVITFDARGTTSETFYATTGNP